MLSMKIRVSQISSYFVQEKQMTIANDATKGIIGTALYSALFFDMLYECLSWSSGYGPT